MFKSTRRPKRKYSTYNNNTNNNNNDNWCEDQWYLQTINRIVYFTVRFELLSISLANHFRESYCKPNGSHLHFLFESSYDSYKIQYCLNINCCKYPQLSNSRILSNNKITITMTCNEKLCTLKIERNKNDNSEKMTFYKIFISKFHEISVNFRF